LAKTSAMKPRCEVTKTLWRALALAWLGGTALPVLTNELPIPEAVEEQQTSATQTRAEPDVLDVAKMRRADEDPA
jgi:hypothetical protein